ncbi:MAG: hypothetical protein ACU826_05515 [Gammaproteobacteria bacterium]
MTVAMAEESQTPIDTRTPEELKTLNLARIAEKIRSGEIDVGKEYSTNYQTGRFHIIHADKLLLDCENCHFGSEYKADYLLMGKAKPMPEKMPGRLQRSVCLGCHREGGMAIRLYDGSAKW